MLVRPLSTYEQLAAEPARVAGFWLALRRPAFLALTFGCIVSLAATGVLTARLVFPTALYWSFVPLAEALGLAVALGLRRRMAFSTALDVYLAGHTAWTLVLVTMMGVLASVPPVHWWPILTRAGIGGVVAAVIWSARTDFCYFRGFAGMGRGRAARALLLTRVITWPLVFGIFAVPDLTPGGVGRVIVDAVRELLR